MCRCSITSSWPPPRAYRSRSWACCNPVEGPVREQAMSEDSDQVTCDVHGQATTTFVCTHLAADPVQRWHSDYPSDDNPWPDSWCDRCNVAFLREGEWNDRNADGIELSILCNQCYEQARGRSVARLTGAHLASWQ